MKMRYPILIVLCAVALLAGASAADAGEVSGLNVLMLEPSETTELGDGVVYQTIGNSGVCMTKDPEHPLYSASGRCSGACVSKGDDDPVCMGSCTWVDSDGDVLLSTWTGQTTGTWSMSGGTGKWAKASGGGTWMATGAFVGGAAGNAWKGTIEME